MLMGLVADLYWRGAESLVRPDVVKSFSNSGLTDNQDCLRFQQLQLF